MNNDHNNYLTKGRLSAIFFQMYLFIMLGFQFKQPLYIYLF